MFCSKCGSEMFEYKRTEKRVWLKCPSCNRDAFVDADKTNAVTEKKEKKMGCFSITGIIIGAIIMLIFFVLFESGPAISGNKGLTVQTIGFIGCSLGILIVSIVKKLRKLRTIISLVIIAYFLILIGAVNNFPEFIRRIPGKDFVELWWKYDIAIFVLALVAEFAIYTFVIKSNSKKLVKMNYSDSDLMILQGFSRYKMTGYYLLKAKLHGLINFKTIKPEEYSSGMICVELNKDIEEDELNYYCEQNPQVEKIIDYLKKQGPEHIRIADVINHVFPSPEIQSDGGQATNTIFGKLKRIRKTVFIVAAVFIYYVGLTKLYMGMHNEKPIEDLAVGGFIVSFIMFGIVFGVSYLFFYGFWLKSLIKKIIKSKQNIIPDFYDYCQPFLMEDNVATIGQQQNILRYYVTHIHDSNHCYNISENAVQNIILSISSAEIAEAKARAEANSDSGCGSSCGGCGGGCGGCGGGCGD